ncbi:outer membrane beta-barrel protein [Hymenobacter sp. B81]|uniref:outer membrane beta-barrel protein n=1 Tax=Hymenobacter sp. B81 TaxID=3344878 RepID=UPI0037DD5534
MKTSTPFRTGWLLALGLAGSSAALAQTHATLEGSVRTTADVPVDYATVTLHRAADSAVVKTEFSNEQGRFLFEQTPAGRYLVSASQVGFGRGWSRPFELAGENLKLPALQLAASAATTLKEVQVVGQKPLFEREADRTIVNVEGSTLAAGNTSLDVLRRSPGVTVDANDNLALRGRQGLLVLIDGKRQPMSGTELADYLRALPAEQLKSIELITNPPAKYDAQGGAGIIAINLRKDQKLGTNGSYNASYGRSFAGNKLTNGLSLNHRRQKINLFGSYNYSNREGVGKLTIHRDFYSAAAGGERQLVSVTDQDNRAPNHGRSHSWRAGFDYNLAERTTLGAVASGLSARSEQDGTNVTTVFDPLTRSTELYNSTNYRRAVVPNVTGNLNLRHTFVDSLGPRELSADVDYARYHTTRDQRLATRFNGAEQVGELATSDQLGELTIQSAKVDYVQPLTKALRLEAGAKASLVTADNDLKFFLNGAFDPARSNRFRYDENINAGYVNLNFTQPGYTLQAGLRGEQTNAVGKQDVVQPGREPNFDRHYFQLFPSAAVKRKFSEQHETSLSLSRRIDRPSYGQLNPFSIIIDKTTSGEGNPFLKPQTSYNFELTHTLRQKYSLGLSYGLTSDPLIGVVQPTADQKVISTTTNLDQQHYYALTLTAPLELAKWWSAYNNGVFYYSRFVGNLAGTGLNRGRAAFNLSSNHTFTIGKGWSAELNGSYQSREVYGFLDVQRQGQVAVGVQKSLWNRKGNLKFNFTDLLYTSPVRATSSYATYVERFFQRYDSRVATLAFSYRFGNDKVAPSKRRGGGAEDEKRRAGGS